VQPGGAEGHRRCWAALLLRGGLIRFALAGVAISGIPAH
jgi:hypothetical protein